MARYAAEGKAVHVIIATDGIAGSVEQDHEMGVHETLAQVRSLELSNAAIQLGVSTIWSLPYRDSGMRNTPENQHPDALVQQPLEQTIQEVLGYIRRLRPDVIITHDPFGGYGHPDHIRVCEATTAAFYLARSEASKHNGKGNDYAGPQKLYYTAFDKRMLKVMVRLMPLMGQDPTAIGRNKDINLVEISRWRTPVHTRIDVVPYLLRKEAASRAHASQYSGGPTFIRILPPLIRRRFVSGETFTRAYPTPLPTLETDLFTGVR